MLLGDGFPGNRIIYSEELREGHGNMAYPWCCSPSWVRRPQARAFFRMLVVTLAAFIFLFSLPPSTVEAFSDVLTERYQGSDGSTRTLTLRYRVDGVKDVKKGEDELKGLIEGNSVRLSGSATISGYREGEMRVSVNATYQDNPGSSNKVESRDYSHKFTRDGSQDFDVVLELPAGTRFARISVRLTGYHGRSSDSLYLSGLFDRHRSDGPSTKHVPIWVPHVCVSCPPGVDIETHKGDLYVDGVLGNRLVQGGYRGNHPVGSTVNFRAAPKDGFSFAYWDVWHSQGKVTRRVTENPFSFVVPDAMDISIRATYRAGAAPPGDKAVESLTITNCPENIEAGKSVKLNARVQPDDAANKKVNWSVDKTDLATVSSDGTVTAKAAGAVTVTARADGDSNIFDRCQITITGSSDRGSDQDATITLNPAVLRFDHLGQQIKIDARVEAPSIDDLSLSWESADVSIAQVDNDGLVLAVQEGETTVTAILVEDPGVSATATVYVSEEEIKVKAVRFYPAAVCMSARSNVKVRYSVEPKNATEKIEWKSTDESVALVVDSTGEVDTIEVVSFNHAVDVRIDAYVNRVSSSGAIVPSNPLGSLHVAIMPPPNRIDLYVASSGAGRQLAAPYQDYRKHGFFMRPGESIWLEGIIFPNDAYNKEVDWSNSNPAAVTLGTKQAADLYVDTSRYAARACLLAKTGSSKLSGRFHPRVRVIANEVSTYEKATIRVVSQHDSQYWSEIQIYVVSDEYLELWQKLREASDEKERALIIQSYRATRLPPFLQSFITEHFIQSPEMQLLWKAKDYHPKGWIANVIVIMARGESWTSLIKELGIMMADKPSVQALDHLIGSIFGEKWHDDLLSVVLPGDPELDPLAELQRADQQSYDPGFDEDDYVWINDYLGIDEIMFE